MDNEVANSGKDRLSFDFKIIPADCYVHAIRLPAVCLNLPEYKAFQPDIQEKISEKNKISL